ncbi:hypothetical protein ACTXT7_002319 [Hymenolepis weldensis]
MAKVNLCAQLLERKELRKQLSDNYPLIYTPNKEHMRHSLLFEFYKGKERQAQQQKRSKTLMEMML